MVRMSCQPIRLFRLALIFVSNVILLGGTQAWPQSAPQASFFASRNSFGIFSAYSNDSSHILLGAAEQRKLLEIGVGYDRLLFLGRILNLQYSAEFLPIALESDPLTGWVTKQSAPNSATYSGVLAAEPIICTTDTIAYATVSNGVPYTGTTTYFCGGRRWTMGGAISPLGFQWNFLPARRLQPFLVAHGGCMYSARPIPAGGTESFNFTFDVGGGFEFYHTPARSMRVEYRVHHISNADLGTENPGIDSGLFQLTYAFRLGR
jgi:hypothetical protein